jgi:hypothetical protein
MKKQSMYEILACVSGLVGAVLLICALMPFINPGFFEVNEDGEDSPGIIFLTGVLSSLAMVGIAWCFYQRARIIEQGTKEVGMATETSLEKRIKWIVCGIAIVLAVTVTTFFW